jgi:transcriptional regulator with PAS, ATPase and Fis domain
MVLGITTASNNEQNSLCIKLDMEQHKSIKSAVEQVEWHIINYMLGKHDKNYNYVASRLGIGRSTLWRKYNNRAD